MRRMVLSLPAVLFVLSPGVLSAVERAKDYVSGKEIAITADTPRAEAKGVTFYFSSADEMKAFQASPEKVWQAASADFGWWVGQAYAHYFAIRKALASDKTEGIAEHFKAVAEWATSAAKLDAPLAEGVLKAYHEELDAAAKAASEFPAEEAEHVQDIDAVRNAFKPLSLHLVLYVRRVASKAKEAPSVFLFHCGMAKACWAQEGAEAGNPYFGASMPKCGDPVSIDEKQEFHPDDGCDDDSGGCKGDC